MRRRVRKVMTSQREAMSWAYPDPAALANLAASRRLWERRGSSEAFTAVRIGVGTQRLAVRLNAPQTKPLEDLEPLCAGSLRRFIRAYASVPGLPTVVFPRAFARILLAGGPGAARGMARAMVAQLVTFHSPEDLWVAVCVAPERRADWDWVKWLPHSQHPLEHDAAGPVRLVSDNLADLEALLGTEFAERPRVEPDSPRPEPYVLLGVDRAPGPAGLAAGRGRLPQRHGARRVRRAAVEGGPRDAAAADRRRAGGDGGRGPAGQGQPDRGRPAGRAQRDPVPGAGQAGRAAAAVRRRG